MLTFILSAQPLGAQEFHSGVMSYSVLLRAGYEQMARWAALLRPSKLGFFADGGGDSDSSSSSDSSGSSDSDSSSSSDSASAAESAAAAAATTAADAPGNADDDAPSNNNNNAPTADPANNDQDPDTDPTTNNNTNPTETDPTNPTNPTVTPELAAIMSIPTTDPRGGDVTASASDAAIGPEISEPGSGVTTVPPGWTAPTEPVNTVIRAVIVTAAQSPWDAIQRAPGVGTVTVTGGIIALGNTPLPGEIPGGGPEPPWLRLIPDLDLLNGSKIPPVVPNIIDIRWLSCPITVEETNH
jgi:hypothetical protein